MAAESTSSHLQVLHRTFNTFHNFATTFGRDSAMHSSNTEEADLAKLLYTSSVVSG